MSILIIVGIAFAWWLAGAFVCGCADGFNMWMGRNSANKLAREPIAVAAWPVIALGLALAFLWVFILTCYLACRTVLRGG